MSRDVPQPFGPTEHKTAARALGVSSVRDLCAQTPQSDPFYCGTPTDIRDAEWFAQLLDTIGLADVRDLHLRRIHYRADALADDHNIRLPHDDRRYGNDRDSWQRMRLASKHARRLGLVDPERFVDRRNPDPTINRAPRFDDEPVPAAWLGQPDAIDAAPTLAELPYVEVDQLGVDVAPVVRVDVHAAWETGLPGVTVTGYDYSTADQPVLVEIWSEKTTVNDVLEPVARRVHANYVPASGTQSITAAVALLRRAEQLDRPAHVLYVSDHDHAGRHMPVSVARDVQYWRDQLHITQPVTVDNLVLTADQVDHYGLPRDPERGDSTELDALEALHPGELGRIAERAAAQYRDNDLEDRLYRAHLDAVSKGREHRDAVFAGLLEERDRLLAAVREVDLDPYRQRIEEHRQRIAEHLDEYRQRIAEHVDGIHTIAGEVAEAMEPHRRALNLIRRRARGLAAEFDPDLPARPQGDVAEPSEHVLYDSGRCWLDQLDAYRAHKDGAS